MDGGLAIIKSSRYSVRKELGRGGMGIVYEAEDKARGMTVALKTLLNLNAESLYHFKNEFRALADVHHPNLVTLYDLLEEEGRWFFTMELLEGGELLPFVRDSDTGSSANHRTLLGTPPGKPGSTESQKGRFSTKSELDKTQVAAPTFDEARLRKCLAQLAAGLNALHNAGKVHRDIKPSNVWVTSEGRVILLDFGLAADEILLEEVRRSGQLAGTPFYMAPEQGRPGEPIGPAADWYAVGVILYEMLRGCLPHHGNSMSELLLAKGSVPDVQAANGMNALPPDLVTLCEQLLNPVASKRPNGHQILKYMQSWSNVAAEVVTPSTAGGAMAQVFVGRREELALLARAFSTSKTRAHALFVEGRSGLGKTALIDTFLDSCRGRGGNRAGRSLLRGRVTALQSVRQYRRCPLTHLAPCGRWLARAHPARGLRATRPAISGAAAGSPHCRAKPERARNRQPPGNARTGLRSLGADLQGHG